MCPYPHITSRIQSRKGGTLCSLRQKDDKTRAKRDERSMDDKNKRENKIHSLQFTNPCLNILLKPRVNVCSALQCIKGLLRERERNRERGREKHSTCNPAGCLIHSIGLHNENVQRAVKCSCSNFKYLKTFRLTLELFQGGVGEVNFRGCFSEIRL